jgi:hypothetical protein
MKENSIFCITTHFLAMAHDGVADTSSSNISFKPENT